MALPCIVVLHQATMEGLQHTPHRTHSTLKHSSVLQFLCIPKTFDYMWAGEWWELIDASSCCKEGLKIAAAQRGQVPGVEEGCSACRSSAALAFTPMQITCSQREATGLMAWNSGCPWRARH